MGGQNYSNILDKLVHNSIWSRKLEIVCLMRLNILLASSVTSSSWWFAVWLTTDISLCLSLTASLSWGFCCWFSKKWWETAVLWHLPYCCISIHLLSKSCSLFCSISLLWQSVPGVSWDFLLAPAVLADQNKKLHFSLRPKRAALNAPLYCENPGSLTFIPLGFDLYFFISTSNFFPNP